VIGVRIQPFDTGGGYTRDPAQWNDASYSRHPVEDIEPELSGAELDGAAHEQTKWLLNVIDEYMTPPGEPGKWSMRWLKVACALHLHSASSEGSLRVLAAQMHCSKQAISKGAVKFRRAVVCRRSAD
jgi:hypothetical protein